MNHRKRTRLVLLLLICILLSGCGSSKEKSNPNSILKEKDIQNLITVDSIIIGKISGQRYTNVDALKKHQNLNEIRKEFNADYNIYSLDGFLGKYKGEIDEFGTNVLFEDLNQTDNFVAMTGYWNAQPRKISVGDNYSEDNIKTIRELLDNHNMSNTPVIIKRIITVDLDNDGVEEQIIEADNTIDYDESVEKQILDKEKIISFDGIGNYRVIVLKKSDLIKVLWEQYQSLSKVDFTFRSNKELGAEDQTETACDLSSELHYLYSTDKKIGLFRPYDCIFGGESGIKSRAWINNILDVDNDNNMEIVLQENIWPNIITSILGLEGNELVTKIKQEYLNP